MTRQKNFWCLDGMILDAEARLEEVAAEERERDIFKKEAAWWLADMRDGHQAIGQNSQIEKWI